MRFIIMHKTSPRWEAGEIPSRELIGRVGALLGEMTNANALHSGEGLRASALGVRVRTSGATATRTPGPFVGENELPAGFTVLRAASLDDAVDWAARMATALGDAEIDVRPVTEPWDIGLGKKPAHVKTTRFMALRKATAASEAGTAPSSQQRAEVARLIEEVRGTGAHVATENMRPSARGRRYKNTKDGVRFTDGPFIESKELIAGYVIVSAGSLEGASKWAERYLSVVETDEVDVRELEDPPTAT